MRTQIPASLRTAVLIICIACSVSAPHIVEGTRGQFPQDSERTPSAEDLLISSGYSKRERDTKKKLEQSFSSEYDGVQLSEVVKQINRKYSVNIVIDRSAIEDSLDPKSPVTFAAKDVTLQQGLQLILSEHNATILVDDAAIRIISKDVAGEPDFQATRVFNVIGLLESISRSNRNTDKSMESSLDDAIKAIVNPDCWDTTMGESTISIVGGMLVVRASHETLVNVEQFISKLTAEIAPKG